MAIACATLLFGAIALTAALDLAGIDGEINAILVGATFFAVALSVPYWTFLGFIR